VVVKQLETDAVEPVVENEPVTETKRTGEQINWWVMAAGGEMSGMSETYELSGTVGQTATGSGASDNYGLGHGFWQILDPKSCCNLPGDANDDAAINVGDAVWMINYVFKGGDAPTCLDEGDANADCALNVGDAVFLINYVFKSGPTPLCGCVE
ncbi:MAG: hypothetical protein GY841_11550, partial [FCB group bacterium]|nr:hypothetical protein [FCB group bacterium]